MAILPTRPYHWPARHDRANRSRAASDTRRKSLRDVRHLEKSIAGSPRHSNKKFAINQIKRREPVPILDICFGFIYVTRWSNRSTDLTIASMYRVLRVRESKRNNICYKSIGDLIYWIKFACEGIRNVKATDLTIAGVQGVQ